jgi:hypothetical protein
MITGMRKQFMFHIPWMYVLSFLYSNFFISLLLCYIPVLTVLLLCQACLPEPLYPFVPCYILMFRYRIRYVGIPVFCCFSSRFLLILIENYKVFNWIIMVVTECMSEQIINFICKSTHTYTCQSAFLLPVYCLTWQRLLVTATASCPAPRCYLSRVLWVLRVTPFHTGKLIVITYEVWGSHGDEFRFGVLVCKWFVINRMHKMLLKLGHHVSSPLTVRLQSWFT